MITTAKKKNSPSLVPSTWTFSNMWSILLMKHHGQSLLKTGKTSLNTFSMEKDFLRLFRIKNTILVLFSMSRNPPGLSLKTISPMFIFAHDNPTQLYCPGSSIARRTEISKCAVPLNDLHRTNDISKLFDTKQYWRHSKIWKDNYVCYELWSMSITMTSMTISVL